MDIRLSWIAVLFVLALGGSCKTSSEADVDSDEFVHLRIVDKATGDPAAGAEVYYLDRSKYDARVWAALGLAALSPEVVRDWFCDNVVADAHGAARIPWSRDITSVEACLGSSSGTVKFDPESTATILVPIEPEPVQSVQVVDPHGQPVAGVPLVLFAWGTEPVDPPLASEGEAMQIFRKHAKEVEYDGHLLWFGRSHAPDGVVEITDPRTIHARAGAPKGTRLCALAEFVDDTGSINHSDGVDWRPAERAAFRLTVPTPGIVVVNVRRPDGSPAARDTVVELSTFPRGFTPKADEEGAVPEIQIARGGRAIFPAVWVGRWLSVSARSFDGSPRVHTILEGPREAGNTVVIDLALGNRLPTLTGRLVDEHGAPLPWTVFDIHWKGDKPDLGLDMDDAITDGTGRFRLDLDETPAVSAGEKSELEIHVQEVVEAAGIVEVASEDLQVFANHASTAHVSLTKPLTPGDIDLGDIVLRQSKE